jgi:O-antigen/teichoic acid export membrane protein
MHVISDVRKMSFAAAFGVLMVAGRSILLLRIVSPDTIGAWKSVMVLYVFAEILRFGVQRGLAARLPALLGEGKHEEADALTLSVTSFAFYSGLLMALVCALLAAFSQNSDYRLGFLMMAGVLFSAQFHILIREITVAHHRFGRRAVETMLASALDFTLVLGLGAWLGIVGIGIGTLACIAIPAAYLFFANEQRISLKPAFAVWFSLAKQGFRFSITDSLYSFLRFSDVAALSILGGSHYVGIYAISQLAHDFSVYIILAAVGQVVTPHLMRVHGESNCLRKSAAVMDAPLAWMSLLMPPILGIGTLIAPPIVELLLPAYVPGLDALQYSLWSVFFLAMHAAQVSFFQAAGEFPRLLKLFAVIVPAAIAGQFVSWHMGWDLAGAAIVGAATLFCASAAEYFTIRGILGEPIAETLWRFTKLNLPFVVCFLACQFLPHPGWILPILVALPLLGWKHVNLRPQLEQSR